MKLFPYLIILLVGSAYLTGCSTEIPENERNEFAQLYAELLIAEVIYDGDSTQLQATVDSLLEGSQFSSMQDVRNWLENTTASNPDALKAIMDSTQRYLEGVRDSRETLRETSSSRTEPDSL